MELKKIKELHKKGIVTHAGLKRAEILIRFNEVSKKHIKLGDVYFMLSEEFHLSELRIRNIIQESNRNNG